MFCLRKYQSLRHFFRRVNDTKNNVVQYVVILPLGVAIAQESSGTTCTTTSTSSRYNVNDAHLFNFSLSTNSKTSHIESNNVTFEPNDPRLKSSECLKSAAGLAVDSTSAVLSQTVYAVIDIERQYVELLDFLGMLMERQLEVLSSQAEEVKVADLILKTQHEINNVYRRKQDLTLLFASVKKLADATAEVAFATGANYASTSIGERFHSAEIEVQQVQAVSEEAEKKIQAIKIKSVETMAKHDQVNSKQKQNR